MTWFLARVDALPFWFVCATVGVAVLIGVWLVSARRLDREQR